MRWVIRLLGGLVVVCVASCGEAYVAQLDAIRSVGISNGLGDRVVRRTVNVSLLGDAVGDEEVPEVRKKVETATMRNLKSRFQTVKMLPAIDFSASGYSSPFRSKNDKLFKERAIASAKKENLDAVWIIYPLKNSIYEPGGMILGGYEHWQQTSMGILREFATCSARAEMVDVKSGEVIARPKANYFNFSAAFQNEFRLTSHDWKRRLSDYDPAVRREIIEGIAQAGENKMVMLLEDSGITGSDAR